ncbi:DUF3089 domain-containing protein [Sphingomonas daechungensis]|uniref:DUF3089 domain-containing protein n=1 Tax=Sphingomonas daechungensis TaxID=1176646 RepID=A0ABX6SY53_9SPHN|nr:DUF3089 domain-containing protein [Sphingomonas daechungensis]
MSNDRGLNSDLNVDNSERSAAQVQFARFAGVCRTFAPIYRQMTLGQSPRPLPERMSRSQPCWPIRTSPMPGVPISPSTTRAGPSC